MTYANHTPTPDEAREIDYVLQKIRFSFISLGVICWLAAVGLYAIAKTGLLFSVLVATLAPAGLALVWTLGLRALRGSLSSFVDQSTRELRIPGGRKHLRVSEGLRAIFWDKRETKVITVGVWGSVALLAVYLLLASPR